MKMLTTVFRRIRLPMLATALTVLTWSSCQAAGSFQTAPVFPSVERNDDSYPPPIIIWPDLSARAFLGGCGKGRVGDPKTHGCRGPADVKGIAP
jgi:hypothetical protein